MNRPSPLQTTHYHFPFLQLQSEAMFGVKLSNSSRAVVPFPLFLHQKLTFDQSEGQWRSISKNKCSDVHQARFSLGSNDDDAEGITEVRDEENVFEAGKRCGFWVWRQRRLVVVEDVQAKENKWLSSS
ncbi:hypothetical protein Droror1_Dr00023969 [Drosera rotundifolia]